MATSAAGLAADVATALGHPGDVSAPVLGWATGVLGELTQNGIATFGLIPGPHPISGMTGASMASKIALAAGYPGPTPILIAYAGAICTHIQSSGFVTYTSPTSPIPPNWFLGGTISGLNGPAMATLVAAACGFPGTTPILIAKCTAIASHIMSNAQVVSGVIS
jgi:hypothetical protein